MMRFGRTPFRSLSLHHATPRRHSVLDTAIENLQVVLVLGSEADNFSLVHLLTLTKERLRGYTYHLELTYQTER